jgi:hypothetical protein
VFGLKLQEDSAEDIGESVRLSGRFAVKLAEMLPYSVKLSCGGCAIPVDVSENL